MRGVLLLASVVIVSALIQALTVVGDPAPTSSLRFAALVVVSAATVVCALWFTASIALDVVDGNASGASSRTLRRPRVLAWCVVLTGMAVALAILFPLLPVIVIVFALLILRAAVDGRRNPLRAALHTVKQSPWRCTAAAVITILAYLLGWVVALVLGFFVTGVVAAFLTWLWFGATAAALLLYWSAVYRKGVGI